MLKLLYAQRLSRLADEFITHIQDDPCGILEKRLVVVGRPITGNFLRLRMAQSGFPVFNLEFGSLGRWLNSFVLDATTELLNRGHIELELIALLSKLHEDTDPDLDLARSYLDTPETAPLLYEKKILALSKQLARLFWHCLLYTSPSPRDATLSRMPSSA